MPPVDLLFNRSAEKTAEPASSVSAGYEGDDVATLIDAAIPGGKTILGNIASSAGGGARSFGLNNLANPQAVGLSTAAAVVQ
jgi:hypothetical protein